MRRLQWNRMDYRNRWPRGRHMHIARTRPGERSPEDCILAVLRWLALGLVQRHQLDNRGGRSDRQWGEVVACRRFGRSSEHRLYRMVGRRSPVRSRDWLILEPLRRGPKRGTKRGRAFSEAGLERRSSCGIHHPNGLEVCIVEWYGRVEGDRGCLDALTLDRR